MKEKDYTNIKQKPRRKNSLIDSIITKSKDIGDAAYLQSCKIGQKMEESGLTNRIYNTSSNIVDKGFEYGAVAYLKTYDKLKEF